MVHRIVSGLGSLFFAALALSIGAGLSAAAPAMPGAAQAAQVSALDLAADPGGGDDDEEPQPSDPQCGACAAYVVREQRLYAYIATTQGAAPYVRLDFYSQSRGLVGTHVLTRRTSYSGGKVIYSVPGGPEPGVADWGVMRWGDQTGAIHEISVPVHSTWAGWGSMDQ
ncbi:hypothetical protein WMF04_14860 [Sorangium sp. So ce260]|uniref:hypothetical protein n=1 Tax=Sorangium sp. So ce260 TaxID=3133291 RepID=UPI003F62935E